LCPFITRIVRRLNEEGLEHHHGSNGGWPLRPTRICKRRDQFRPKHLEIHCSFESRELVAQIIQPLKSLPRIAEIFGSVQLSAKATLCRLTCAEPGHELVVRFRSGYNVRHGDRGMSMAEEGQLVAPCMVCSFQGPGGSRSADTVEAVGEKRAILTYHRILDNCSVGELKGADDRSFYDVPMQRFQNQMQKLAASTRRREGGPPLPSVEVTLDDGTEDHVRAAKVLSELGLSGIFFVITGRLGMPGYLSRQDVRAILSLGSRVGSHTVTHRRMPNLTRHELRQELMQSRDTLEQLVGTRIEWLAPPGGYLDDRCLEASLNCGYRFVRTMRWGYASGIKTGQVPCIPILPGTSDKSFDKIINGKALFLGFRLKEGLKRTIGENAYLLLRNRLWRLRHAP
jgi:peptidoglycan/xylan/chitin deacetylase (PgdA/CDA1 family)